MRSIFGLALLVLTGLIGACGTAEVGLPDLPIAVTNNAVAVDTGGDRVVIYSALGLDSTRRWSGITRRAFRLVVGAKRWEELPAVPGPVGRVAATAQVMGGRFILIGGYTVDSLGGERSVPDVNIFDPVVGEWVEGAPMPLAVDDAVSGVWRDSLLYVVSGWHDTDNVQAVQIYDPLVDRWFDATPIPGPGVFGHTGGIVGDAIVYVDGVVRNEGRPWYTLIRQAWRGEIDPERPDSISWGALPEHPGPPTYRAAAGTCGSELLVVGGTDNPYNYEGIGYNGRPSEPISGGFTYREEGGWTPLVSEAPGTMDHRGLVFASGHGLTIGGMEAGPQVTARVAQVIPRHC